MYANYCILQTILVPSEFITRTEKRTQYIENRAELESCFDGLARTRTAPNMGSENRQWRKPGPQFGAVSLAPLGLRH